MSIYRDTIAEIEKLQDDSARWFSQPTLQQCVKKGSPPVNLADAVGPNAKTPANAPNQPRFHPRFSKFQFDPSQFKGESCKEHLITTIRNMFPCSKLYLHRTTLSLIELRCQHYPTQHTSSLSKFTPDKFSKSNCKVESVKHERRKHSNALSRMDNPKMRSAPRKHAPKKTIPTIERRGKRPSASNATSKRCSSVRAPASENRCRMAIFVFMHEVQKTWHLSVKSNFCHSFHTPLTSSANIFTADDLNKDQRNTLRILHGSGVSHSVIARAMSQSVQLSSGRKGEFLVQTIRNIGTKDQKTIDILQGMKPDWSEAEKVLHLLDR